MRVIDLLERGSDLDGDRNQWRLPVWTHPNDDSRVYSLLPLYSSLFDCLWYEYDGWRAIDRNQREYIETRGCLRCFLANNSFPCVFFVYSKHTEVSVAFWWCMHSFLIRIWRFLIIWVIRRWLIIFPLLSSTQIQTVFVQSVVWNNRRNKDHGLLRYFLFFFRMKE